MAITFRGYEAGDFEAMFSLDEVCFDPRFRFSRRLMRRYAESASSRVVLAIQEDELAGFFIVQVESKREELTGYLMTLDVHPALRKRGLGGSLLLLAEAEAAAAGCSAMTLHVFTENLDAQRLYESLGYARVGLSEGFYGVGAAGMGLDALAYRKQLSVPPV